MLSLEEIEHQGNTCLEKMALAITFGGVKSEHQMSKCKPCRKDASRYNHCSWCGQTFTNNEILLLHLDNRL